MAVALALLAAGFAAASLRLSSLLSTALAAYLALVANIGLVTWALSPVHEVTSLGLTGGEAVLLVASVAVWWLRGRPGLALGPAAGALRVVGGDPVVVLFLAVAGLALGYELLLALTVPPTNWDSLTYHLSRVAAWKQHHGISWIPNAPTARMNEFQPLAEQEILFLIVGTGTTAVFALPQYVAELAILAAVYGASRRLGFGARASACSAALLATFSLIALEATTAQNDLVAASFPIVAACLLLGAGSSEAVLAGIAVGLGLGAKLTTALALPVLLWIAWSTGRRNLKLGILGGGLGFVAVGVWGFVLNLVHTGHLLGHGQGRTENTVSLSLSGTVRTVGHLLDRLADLSLLSDWLVAALAVAGVALGAATLVARRHAADRGSTLLAVAAVALPLLTPALVLALTRIPAGDPSWIERDANEDYAAFGPLGTFALVAAPIATAVAVRRRDSRQLALALALPSYMILLALYAAYNIWITRFLIVPAVLTAPLFGRLFRTRLATASILVVAAVTVGVTLARDVTKPLGGSLGRPWELTQAQALAEGPAEQEEQSVGASLVAYERLVPERACVGAVLDPDEPSYLLWGPNLRHRVFFLSSLTAAQQAAARGLRYVVISTGANAPVSKQFTGAGWKVKPVASYWQLAVAPPTAKAACG